jgi:hypothetical protein
MRSGHVTIRRDDVALSDRALDGDMKVGKGTTKRLEDASERLRATRRAAGQPVRYRFSREKPIDRLFPALIPHLVEPISDDSLGGDAHGSLLECDE